ncbi:MAG: hypothetical protein FJ144_10285 [Deltaproteobacteria bacterium]|nr:hypothetical protein [Deltaproteobacteria bacterium]
MSTTTLVATLAIALAAATPAGAQAPSGRQTSPDGKQVLVNKEEGGLQFAISLNPSDGTVTGNVFNPDGSDPQFIWCKRLSDDGVLDPETVDIEWDCYGSSRCTRSPCLATSWVPLGIVNLGGFFFLPARDPFVPLQQPGSFCDPSAVMTTLDLIEPALEVDTNICSYATIMQPARTSIQPGEDLFLRVWHFALEEPRGGTAIVSMMMGGKIVWQESFPIPTDSGLSFPCFVPDEPVVAGEPIYFNVQYRLPPGGSVPSSHEAAPQDDLSSALGITDGLGSPLHSVPGLFFVIEASVGSNCQEQTGRSLVNPDDWTVVSNGLPPLPGL